MHLSSDLQLILHFRRFLGEAIDVVLEDGVLRSQRGERVCLATQRHDRSTHLAAAFYSVFPIVGMIVVVVTTTRFNNTIQYIPSYGRKAMPLYASSQREEKFSCVYLICSPR